MLGVILKGKKRAKIGIQMRKEIEMVERMSNVNNDLIPCVGSV